MQYTMSEESVCSYRHTNNLTASMNVESPAPRKGSIFTQYCRLNTCQPAIYKPNTPTTHKMLYRDINITTSAITHSFYFAYGFMIPSLEVHSATTSLFPKNSSAAYLAIKRGLLVIM